MSEKRVDPDDKIAYTWEELAAYYKGTYKKTEIEAYWETCKPVRAKGKGKTSEPAPKAKSKAKAKAKVEPKARAESSDEPKAKGNFKVCVCGGAGGIGQPLSLLMGMDPNVGDLRIFDLNVAMVAPAGVATDLSHLERKCKVQGHVMEVGQKPVDHLEDCLTGCHLVLVPAGMPRKPGMTRDDLFGINADIAKGIVEACAKFCPDAVLGMIVNPVNSVVPAMAELYKRRGLDPLKIVGITTLDVVRANKFVGEITGKNANFINVPVIGGHAGATIMPVFSQDKTSATIDQEKIPDLDKHVQNAGTDVVDAKGGKGSATLSMAYAGARFGKAVLAGLTGRKRVECAYCASDITDLPYFTQKVVLGEGGIVKLLPLGELNEYETKRLEEAKVQLKTEIETGLKYAAAQPGWEFQPKKGERVFLFSSESVNEGHPDKLCDQVSDAVLDECLTSDPKSKVACETVTKDNMVMVAGEITTQAKIDYEKTVRGVVAKIGFDSYVDDLSSVDSKGLSDKTCEVLVRINKQSPDIAGGVHVGKDDLDVGAGDQGIMFGYASDETEDCMPLTHSVATRLGKKLTDVRKSGLLWWLRPDGKTQVTIQYIQKVDGSVEPRKIHTVVISTQHAEPLKATRSKEVAGYTGPDATAPSMEEMNRLIVEEVVKKTLEEITLKSGKLALSLYGDFTHLHINPSGKFIIGGPQGDAGLTGRKIIIDTYGGWGAHGGGAFSGKDPTKVDRSAAYICRQMAKSVVKSGLCKRALVQLSYAIGVAKPLSLFVETYGTEQGKLDADDITNVIKIAFDCRPGAIAQSLALREPKYQETAAYCHFGREPYTKDGIKFFEWENTKNLSRFKSMSSKQVSAELKKSKYLTKWVD